MRTVLLLAVVSLVVLGGPAPAPVRAEEGETSTPWYLELLRPVEASAKMNAEVQAVPRNQQRPLRQRMAAEYLDAWQGAGLAPEDAELDALYSLNLSALRYGEALALVLPRLLDEDLALSLRAVAAGRASSIVRNYGMAQALGDDVEAEAVAALEALLPQLAGDDEAAARGSVHGALAAHAGRHDDEDGQIRHLMLAAEAMPATAGSAGRTIVRILQGRAHDLDGYVAVRQQAEELLPTLRELATKHLEAVKVEADERTLRVAESAVKLLETVDRPLTMLGAPVEAWTLEHAYGDVQALADLEGKVVVLDFWATWCPWCIKSFPALRDLLRDYADKGLVVVGVTASASAVYEQRYDLDDDLKDKADPAVRPQAVARLARDGQRKDGSPPSLPDAEYREVEHETLARFIENHQMTWPVVMIDKEEPGSKFALTGWPHAVVIDRQGRVRYFKSGALLRDRPEAVAAFRKVLDDLLAEEAQPAAE
jgi:thiol-disulfide isomerase/thioredoxin